MKRPRNVLMVSLLVLSVCAPIAGCAAVSTLSRNSGRASWMSTAFSRILVFSKGVIRESIGVRRRVVSRGLLRTGLPRMRLNGEWAFWTSLTSHGRIRTPAAYKVGAASEAPFAAETITLFPETEQSFGAMYDRTIAENSDDGKTILPLLRQFTTAIRAFTEAGAQNLGHVSSESTSLGQIVEVMRQAKEGGKTVVVVVGHSMNQNGERVLRLPDGQSISIEALHAMAADQGLACRVLTCKASDFGIDQNISPSLAFHLWRYATGASPAFEPLLSHSVKSNFGKSSAILAQNVHDYDDKFDSLQSALNALPSGRDWSNWGTSLNDDGELEIWERSRGRPNFLRIAISLLGLVVVQTCSVMAFVQRQRAAPARSGNELTSIISHQFRRIQRAKLISTLLFLTSGLIGSVILAEIWRDWTETDRISWTVSKTVALATFALSGALWSIVRSHDESSLKRRWFLGVCGAVAGSVFGFFVGGTLAGMFILPMLIIPSFLIHLLIAYNGAAKHVWDHFGNFVIELADYGLSFSLLIACIYMIAGFGHGFMNRPIYLTLIEPLLEVFRKTRSANVEVSTEPKIPTEPSVSVEPTIPIEPPAPRPILSKRLFTRVALVLGVLGFAACMLKLDYNELVHQTPFLSGKIVKIGVPLTEEMEESPDAYGSVRILGQNLIGIRVETLSYQTCTSQDIMLDAVSTKWLKEQIGDRDPAPVLSEFLRGYVFAPKGTAGRPGRGPALVLPGTYAIVVQDKEGGQGERFVRLRVGSNLKNSNAGPTEIAIAARHLFSWERFKKEFPD